MQRHGDPADEFVPVAETEFARDATFGYTSSNLVEFLAEKSGGRVQARSLSLSDIRDGGPDRVRDLLAEVHDGQWVVVNAGGHGFYRARYHSDLSAALKENLQTKLSSVERFSLLNDTWATTLASLSSLPDYLSLIDLFRDEYALPLIDPSEFWCEVQHPLCRFDIGSVDQDLRECCDASLFTSVGRGKRPNCRHEGGRLLHLRHRQSASTSHIHDITGTAAQRPAERGVFAASRRRSLRRREAILDKDHGLRSFVCDRLAEGWTPEQIAGWLKAGHERGLQALGYEAIYSFIYRAARKGENLWRYLTRCHKRRRPRRARPSRDIIKDRASIHDRPTSKPALTLAIGKVTSSSASARGPCSFSMNANPA